MIAFRATFATILAATVLAPGDATGQEVRQPFLADVWHAARAAERILTSSDAVGLEAFDGPRATGVYLHGTLDGERESVAWGVDPEGRRYSWFSIARGDSVEYVAMLFDVDLDLTPDFLLFRNIDWVQLEETLVEYRTREIMDAPIDIQVQSACVPPKCDPETWTEKPRRVVEVSDEFFHAWRDVWGLAATRGEPWLGKPKSLLVPGMAEAEPPEPPEP